MATVLLLSASNILMTIAWYWHLKHKDWPLWQVVLISWGIALFEYLLQVPANRIGYTALSLGQLKMLQEVIAIGEVTVPEEVGRVTIVESLDTSRRIVGLRRRPCRWCAIVVSRRGVSRGGVRVG